MGAAKIAYDTWRNLHAPFATTWEQLPRRSQEVWETVARAVIQYSRVASSPQGGAGCAPGQSGRPGQG